MLKTIIFYILVTLDKVVSTAKVPIQYVWHCHVVELEDSEMMRPYRIGPYQPGQPMRTNHRGTNGSMGGM
jgi:hypothetical protein